MREHDVVGGAAAETTPGRERQAEAKRRRLAAGKGDAVGRSVKMSTEVWPQTRTYRTNCGANERCCQASLLYASD